MFLFQEAENRADVAGKDGVDINRLNVTPNLAPNYPKIPKIHL